MPDNITNIQEYRKRKKQKIVDDKLAQHLTEKFIEEFGDADIQEGIRDALDSIRSMSAEERQDCVMKMSKAASDARDVCMWVGVDPHEDQCTAALIMGYFGFFTVFHGTESHVHD